MSRGTAIATPEVISQTSGKVRDIYDLGDQLALVSTDRISAFDQILPTLIPNKGRILHAMSLFWFKLLSRFPNHFISDDADVLREALHQKTIDPQFIGRTMIVHKLKIAPIECIVRGYLSGSAWQTYQATQTVCDIALPPGLTEGSRLPAPIFTPSTKAESGQHDVNISFAEMTDIIQSWICNSVLGQAIAIELRETSLAAYRQASAYALQKGIIIADTKLEWGLGKNGDLILADEVFTPDSSRFWPAAQYKPGHSQPSFDKQYVRDWLTKEAKWNQYSPAPRLPQPIIAQTAAKYAEAYRRLTGQALSL